MPTVDIFYNNIITIVSCYYCFVIAITDFELCVQKILIIILYNGISLYMKTEVQLESGDTIPIHVAFLLLMPSIVQLSELNLSNCILSTQCLYVCVVAIHHNTVKRLPRSKLT